LASFGESVCQKTYHGMRGANDCSDFCSDSVGEMGVNRGI
jgi:hypothetical protein